ncbi:MAG TPA: PKD domain-containing protein, partial [Ilumatobacteraceae bacterium]|nr:PKD domain-containing protein [Ilumatobacteraceae bacterium]
SLTVKASLDLAGTDVRVRVTTTDGWNTTTDVSAPFSIGGQLSDGLIAFNDWQTGAVWTASIDGGGAKKIVDSGRHPRWSPDGTRLAWDRTDLYTAKPDGSDVRKVTSGKTYTGPIWVGDDRLLAKLENAYPQGNQLVATADGSATDFGSTSASKFGVLCDVTTDGARVLSRAGLYEDSWSTFTTTGEKSSELRAVKSCGSVSPDGRYAVGTKYRSDSDSRIDVIVVDLKTGAKTNLTNGTFGGYNAYPTWSPTGEWIVWGSNKDRSGATGFGATDLWRIRPDGTGAQKIVDGAALGNKNFEQPDVQAARGLEPDPEPTREELRPSADAGGPYSGGEGAAVALDARGSKPGASGEAVTAYAWDLDGDGAYDDADGAQPNATFPDDGAYPVAVQVTDAAGRVATDTAEVTVANAAPVISGARVNDDDPAVFTATVKDAGVQDVQEASVDWGDGSPAETVPVVATDDGYLVTASRTLPGATVKLTVSDGDGGSPTAAATRILLPANAAPSAGAAKADVRQGETVDVDLPATDPEGDRLAYEIVDQPEHGRISLRALDPLAPEQPEVTYVAGADYTGEDTFTYRVSDGTGTSAKATVKVTVAPLPADEGGPGTVEPEPEHPAPEAPAEPEARGPGREGTKPVDQQQVEDATEELAPGGPKADAPAASQIVSLPSA